jgi:hypothetical protein
MIAIARKPAIWLLPFAAACAFGDGGGFTSLAPGELHAHFEGDDEAATDRGYRVQLNALSVQVHEFALLEVGESDVSFSEIAHVAIERELDLLNEEEIELAPFEPAADLGAGTIARAELFVEGVAVNAVVEGGSLEEPLAIEAQVDVDAVMAAPLALVLSRDVPERIAPTVVLRAGGTLFDGIDFAAPGSAQGLVKARLADWIAAAELEVDLGVVADEHEDEHEGEEEGHSH